MSFSFSLLLFLLLLFLLSKVHIDAVKNKTGTTLRISTGMFHENNLPHELLLTMRQKTKLRNALNNNTSIDIKLSKAQITKIIQSGGFLGSLLSKLAGPLMKVVGITAAASAIDAEIQKKYMDLEIQL